MTAVLDASALYALLVGEPGAVEAASTVTSGAAEQLGGTLVSSDEGQLRVASRVGVAVHPIANSAGVVPEV